MIFERRQSRLLSRSAFLRRMARHGGIAVVVVAGSLVIGACGYHFLERLSWIDSVLNAAMILGGMGPVNALHTSPGKIFASIYALYSGIVFLVVAGILFVPVFHRFLHHFHLDQVDDDGPDG